MLILYHTSRHLGSPFSNQRLNLSPLAVEAESLNHWTTKEIPAFLKLYLFLSLLFFFATIVSEWKFLKFHF